MQMSERNQGFFHDRIFWLESNAIKITDYKINVVHLINKT